MQTSAIGGHPAHPHRLPALPYADDALAPYITTWTVGLHHGRHECAYVEKTNALVVGGPLEELSLEELIHRSARDPALSAVFNNAAQAWNHAFYWQSMRPRAGRLPQGAVRSKVEEAFGGVEEFREAFSNLATTFFGAGWLWLVLGDGRLDLMTTRDADTPLVHGKSPLLAIDLWEHAYYLDYQNRRAAYVEAYLDHLINWDFAAENLARDKGVNR